MENITIQGYLGIRSGKIEPVSWQITLNANEDVIDLKH